MKVIVGIDITRFNYKHVHVPYIQTDTGRNRYLGIELKSGRILDYSTINVSRSLRLYRAWKKLMLVELIKMAYAGDTVANSLYVKLTATDEKILIVN